MFRKIWIALTIAIVITIALLKVWAMNATRFSAREMQNSVPTPMPLLKANDSALSVSPCENALSQGAVCGAANEHVLEIMNA